MSDPNNDAEDIDVLAKTIYGEDRGGGKQGMQAVANVVMNRCAIAAAYMLTNGKPHPLFGDGSPASACKVPWQFSTWNAADPNSKIIADVDTSNPVFKDAVWVATGVINGVLGDLTQGSCYYYAKGSPEPSWAIGHTPVAAVGGNIFFNNI